MSEQSENKGKLSCDMCPFLDCYETEHYHFLKQTLPPQKLNTPNL